MSIYVWKPLMDSQYLAMFGGYWSNVSGDITYLTYNVTVLTKARD